ncbi:MAG: hypothetical protein LBT18_00590 [Endomicrobium sp.]|jgi:hypothetical protein|nr:hypothetical protein [Endomicrobium sp.]
MKSKSKMTKSLFVIAIVISMTVSLYVVAFSGNFTAGFLKGVIDKIDNKSTKQYIKYDCKRFCPPGTGVCNVICGIVGEKEAKKMSGATDWTYTSIIVKEVGIESCKLFLPRLEPFCGIVGRGMGEWSKNFSHPNVNVNDLYKIVVSESCKAAGVMAGTLGCRVLSVGPAMAPICGIGLGIVTQSMCETVYEHILFLL